MIYCLIRKKICDIIDNTMTTTSQKKRGTFKGEVSNEKPKCNFSSL